VAIKSILTPENSIVAGLATVGLVAGVYALDVGPVSSVHLSDANTPPVTSSIKKAGYTSLIMVAGISLLARDPNIVILGGAAIIAFHSHYRHANMSNPGTGQMEPSPGASAYANATTGNTLTAVAS
jgi:hypothetical protein